MLLGLMFAVSLGYTSAHAAVCVKAVCAPSTPRHHSISMQDRMWPTTMDADENRSPRGIERRLLLVGAACSVPVWLFASSKKRPKRQNGGSGVCQSISIYVKVSSRTNASPERAVPASMHGTACSNAAGALAIGPAALGRLAKQPSHLACAPGRVEHGPPDRFCRRATSDCSCSHASPSAAMPSEGA